MLNPNFFTNTQTNCKLSFFINNNENSKETELLIKDAYKNCINLSDKKLGYCEISNEYYNKEDIDEYKIKGSRYVNIHINYGSILYHKNHDFRLKYLDTLFMINNNVFINHSLQNKFVKIKRSNGNIENCKIPQDSLLRFNNTNDLGINIDLKIKLNLSDEETIEATKFIPLFNYNSFSLKKKNYGLYDLNKNIFDNNFVLEIYLYKNLPNWLILMQNDWINKIKIKLNSKNLNKKNYKFIYQ